MAFSLFLQLYGCAETCERARALLENLPQIRRIDGKNTRLFLLPLMPIVYAFSRNGSPLSL